MKNALIFLLLIVAGLLALGQDRSPRAAIEDTTAPRHRVDYRECVMIRTGPLQRPDGYNARPFTRRKDDA